MTPIKCLVCEDGRPFISVDVCDSRTNNSAYISMHTATPEMLRKVADQYEAALREYRAKVDGVVTEGMLADVWDRR